MLLAAEGVSSPKIAAMVGVNRNQVDLWKHRYREHGLAGLVDRPRSGRPLTYGPVERLQLVKTITTRPPESGQFVGSSCQSTDVDARGRSTSTDQTRHSDL